MGCEAIKLDLIIYVLIYRILLDNRSNGVSNSLHVDQESLGTTKLQEHVQTNRHMVFVVGNIEVNYLLILFIFQFHIG